MNLSQSDIRSLETLFGRMEKRAKAWRVSRWMLLLTGTVILLCAIPLGTRTSESLTKAIPDDPEAIVTESDLYASQVALGGAFLGGLSTIGQVLAGIFVLGFTLGNWRKPQQNLLLAKLAKTCLKAHGCSSDASQADN
jgi:hypothetical protein